MTDIAAVVHWRTDVALSSSMLAGMAGVMNPGNRLHAAQWHDAVCGLVQVNRPFTAPEQHETQPLLHAAAGIRLVASARLDNRAALCERLAIPASECAEVSDAGLILRAYLHWGEECAGQLLGDFAFVVWDSRSRRLFCARDQRGEVPLFWYFEERRRLALATAAGALLTLPGVDAELNLQMLADRLGSNAGHDCTQTFFARIRMLPAGHCLVAGEQGVRVRAYWQWEPERRIHFPRDEQYVEAFRDIFFQAVESRMAGFKPVGAHLSGGLDSSSVAAVAARRLAQDEGRLPTFTQVPVTRYQSISHRAGDDDRHLVQLMQQRQPNMDTHWVSSGDVDLDAGLDEFFALAHLPPLNAFNRLWIDRIASACAAQGLGAVLTGVAGNLTVSCSVMSLRLQELARQHRWQQWWRETQHAARVRRRPHWRLLASEMASHWPWSRSSARETPEVFMQTDFACRMNVAERCRNAPADFASRRLQRLLSTQNQIPVINFAGLRRCGVRTLDPTNDLRVVEFCLALPYEQQFHQGWDRAIIRRAMDPYLPADVIWRRDRGRQAADWMLTLDRSLDQVMDDLHRMRQSALASEALNVPLMQQRLQQWSRGDQVYRNRARDYQLGLMRAWLVGRFILWSERQSACIAAAA